ncbi:MAG TPA: hypothetical protein VJQ08_02865 [Candidatus Dormibacteraeota bacterium]|nr:hypothetical protein [Candidatus Dormibacteraeota bacterium]
MVYSSDYGFISAQTVTGAVCSARAQLPNGDDAPGVHNPQVARAGDGMVQWVYPQPPTDEGTGLHTVTCTLNGLSGTTWSNFEVGN